MKPEEVISEVLRTVANAAKPGITLLELDRIAENSISIMGAVPYNKGYHPNWAPLPYPATLCIGLNDTFCHGIPDDTVIQEGDLLNIDCGIKIDGKCGDAALTIPIGEVANKHDRLLRYAKRALYKGISVIKDGVMVSEIGKAIEKYTMQMGYVVNRNMRGHGIGEEMHQYPIIPHYDWLMDAEKGLIQVADMELRTGMIICIEPHITFKDKYGYRTPDGWSMKTRDGKASAFFEHMVEVMPEGYNILTNHIVEGEVI